MSVANFHSVNLPGIVFGSILTPKGQLVLDLRDEKKQTITYFKLDLKLLKLEQLLIHNSEWWTKLVSVDEEDLYYTQYEDRRDPNLKLFFKATWDGKSKKEVEKIPFSETQMSLPSLYEVGTDHHKTVSDFLGLELPLSCEYMEWQKKIIISYYLRSDVAFDIFILLLDKGNKESKLHQDHQMKGFSSGAFFIHNDRLIFFKELNEVCIYDL